MRTIRFVSLLLCLSVLGLVGLPSLTLAQFNSGSSGANGAFPPGAVPALTTEITLDLRDGTVTFLDAGGVPLDAVMLPAVPAGGFQDGIVQFTTVDVPEGVTLRIINNLARTPVTILATGDVNVAGTIDVRGENGDPALVGRGGFGGPGGFKGGNGQITRTRATLDAAGEGLGPGGGKGGGFGNDSDGVGGGGGAGFGTVGLSGDFNNPANGGSTYGTLGLLPMVGGSGGGGGSAKENGLGSGGGGGGGGGAILIASSTTIDVSGSILAIGGRGGNGVVNNISSGGGGSGGAIRLMAETLSVAGTLSAAGGGRGTAQNRNGGRGGLGRIRLEAVTFNFTGTITGISNNGGLGPVFLPNPPSVRIVTVGPLFDPTLHAVPASPTGNIGGTDVIVDAPGTFTIGLAASQVPLGTTIRVTAKPETDAAPIGPVFSLGLSGTVGDSTTTVDLTFPTAGLFFIEARATFTVP